MEVRFGKEVGGRGRKRVPIKNVSSGTYGGFHNLNVFKPYNRDLLTTALKYGKIDHTLLSVKAHVWVGPIYSIYGSRNPHKT